MNEELDNFNAQLRQFWMIRIGTRGSQLALKQAHEAVERLARQHGLGNERFEIVEIHTEGDRIQDRPLSEVGGKGLFTKEIERALLDGRIDIAVHSMKDVETAIPDGTDMAAILEREDVRDVFISEKYASLADMPAGAKLGTSSLRRRAQAKYANSKIELVDFRGNVQTRLGKLASGVADATFLARAGLNRLGLDPETYVTMEPVEMLPAVAQGAIGLQVRSDDAETRDLVAPLDDQATALCIAAERRYLALLNGSCRTPIAGLGVLEGDQFRFRGAIYSLDGTVCHTAERLGSPRAAPTLAEEAAKELLERAGPTFFEAG